ncbi:unnamed protein product, partial [Ranitomeya imitator]
DSIATGSVPQDWRIANVVPIFKKGSKSEPGNYRPIGCIQIKMEQETLKKFEKIKDTMEDVMEPGTDCTGSNKPHKVGIIVDFLAENTFGWFRAALSSHYFSKIIKKIEFIDTSDTDTKKILKTMSSCTFYIYMKSGYNRETIPAITWRLGFLTERKNLIIIIYNLEGNNEREKERILRENGNWVQYRDKVFLFSKVELHSNFLSCLVNDHPPGSMRKKKKGTQSMGRRSARNLFSSDHRHQEPEMIKYDNGKGKESMSATLPKYRKETRPVRGSEKNSGFNFFLPFSDPVLWSVPFLGSCTLVSAVLRSCPLVSAVLGLLYFGQCRSQILSFVLFSDSCPLVSAVTGLLSFGTQSMGRRSTRNLISSDHRHQEPQNTGYRDSADLIKYDQRPNAAPRTFPTSGTGHGPLSPQGTVIKHHRVGIFSRSDDRDYYWLVEKLRSEEFRSLVANVKSCFIYNSQRFQDFIDDINQGTVGILYHSKSRGRVNVTDVTDSLYDQELQTLHLILGKSNVLVIIDDLEDSGDYRKKGILQEQRSIAQWAADLVLVSHDDKMDSRLLRKKIDQLKAFLRGAGMSMS